MGMKDIWLLVVSRVIFSLYVDIKTVSHHESKAQFNKHYDWLLSTHKKYAFKHNIEYKHYVYDDEYIMYRDWFLKEYPEVSEYNIVNFYKIHLLYKLSEEYDEILYLDFDVIPVTDLNFFDEWDLSKGIAIMSGTAEAQKGINELDTLRHKHNIRSPFAKYWNAKVMFTEKDIDAKSEVFNTGIIGASKERLSELDYFNQFKETLEFMTDLINDDFYPDSIRCLFGYDNETIFAYKLLGQKLPFQQLDNGWHHFMDKWDYIPNNSKFIHCISKNFDYVRGWCEKNNI